MYRLATMDALFTAEAHADIQGLAQAIATTPDSDALHWPVSVAQSELLAGYFQLFDLQGGQTIFEQGALQAAFGAFEAPYTVAWHPT